MRKGTKTTFVDELMKLAELHFGSWQVPFLMDLCQ